MPLKTLCQVFFWPAVMALLTLLGLSLALLVDGVFEQVALLGIVLPIVVVLYFYTKSFYSSKPKRDRL